MVLSYILWCFFSTINVFLTIKLYNFIWAWRHIPIILDPRKRGEKTALFEPSLGYSSQPHKKSCLKQI